MLQLLFALALLVPGPSAGETVVVRAGTILPVDGPRINDGAVLIRDGRIAIVGTDVVAPVGARVVDYGPDAVVMPGLVSANGNFGVGLPSNRTADPTVQAIENVDFYSTWALQSLAAGVTTVYTAPARGRLIAGQGAVVKLAGSGPESRTLSDSAAIHGAISAEARSTPGFWEPPVPATVDVGMGESLKQLPRTTMGAIVALRELLELARGGEDRGWYGAEAGPALASLMEAGLPWRIEADSEAEVRALVRFFGSEKLPLVLESASAAGPQAAELAKIGAAVVVEVDYVPGAPGRDTGTGRDDPWPSYDSAAALAEAGVTFAIAPRDGVSARHLRFAAMVASRGDLEAARALRAITLDAAAILGVAERVGSLTPGKDADLCVMTGSPLEAGSTVLATWVDGELAWEGSDASTAVVISAHELHIGDGRVLRPGELLIQDGKIVAVGEAVSRPRGAQVVRGPVVMPGMIDAMGRLGLDGSRKSPGPDFKLSRIVAPGDEVDRRVARAGVTTVVLTPRGQNANGTPMLAYKPAGHSLPAMIVDDPAAIRLAWSDSNRLKSGKRVRELLEKAAEYDRKWREYDEAMAQWTPPEPEAAEAEDDDEEDGEDEDEDAEKENGDDDEKGSKKKKRKKKDEKAFEPDPAMFVGVWTGSFDEAELRLALWRDGDDFAGTLRCAALSEDSVHLEGELDDDDELELSGIGSGGWLDVEVELEGPDELEFELEDDDEGEDEDDEGDDEGEATEESADAEDDGEGGEEDAEDAEVAEGEDADADAEDDAEDADAEDADAEEEDAEEEDAEEEDEDGEIELKRASAEVPRAQRPERRRPDTGDKKEPKGKPKRPGEDAKLEPLRRAIHGQAAVVVLVDREDDILACVAVFEQYGIRPILSDARQAWRVADQIAGRVAGVILSPAILEQDPRGGFDSEVNRYTRLHDAGIQVAFQSGAEEGARDLPLMIGYAVAEGLSRDGALRAATAGAADMLLIGDRVGRLAPGLDADVLLLDGEPLEPSTSVLRTWVDGREVR